jgi:hypothetical protein
VGDTPPSGERVSAGCSTGRRGDIRDLLVRARR